MRDMQISHRKIDVTFRLGTGQFGEGAYNTVTVSGLRVQCNVADANGPQMGLAQVRIYGITPSIMKTVSALNEAVQASRKNILIVSAGDDLSGMATIFGGQIRLCQIDLSAPPYAALNVMAFGGGFEALKTTVPSSYPGTAKAEVILQDLATRMKYKLEKTLGTTATLATPYLSGTLRDQVQQCADAAGFDWNIFNDTLAIWPRGKARNGTSVPLISKETGLVGYPSYSSGTFQGLALTTVFNPTLRIGQQIKVQSSLDVANGAWLVYDLNHSLESETPEGQWFSRFNAIGLTQ